MDSQLCVKGFWGQVLQFMDVNCIKCKFEIVDSEDNIKEVVNLLLMMILHKLVFAVVSYYIMKQTFPSLHNITE